MDQPQGIPDFDARIIEQFADKLYRKASSVGVGSIVVGGASGLAFGAIPLTSLGAAWPIPSSFGFATLLLGSIVGSVIGYVIGDARSFGYRLQAQSALAQVELVRAATETARAMTALTAAASARRPAAASAPAPAPAPAPRATVATPPAPAPAPALRSAPEPAPPAPPVAAPPASAPAPAASTLNSPPLSPPVSAQS